MSIIPLDGPGSLGQPYVAMAMLCHCYPTSDRRIAELVGEGLDSLDAIGDACGAGAGCGGCIEAIEALLSSADVRGEQAA
jgi:bacterioferritin-associated ferredoxin